MCTVIAVNNYKRAYEQATEIYTTEQLEVINNKIKQLSKEHYRYGAKMPLVIGKARGIQNVLSIEYNVHVSIFYIWAILTGYRFEQ